MPNLDLDHDIEKMRQDIRDLEDLRSLVKTLQKEVAELKSAKTSTTTTPPAPVVVPSGVTRHGDLTGLTADDHTQYLTKARGDALYLTPAQADALYLKIADGLTTVQVTAQLTGPGAPGSETFVAGQLVAEVPAT